jgi:hypothetical protein
MGRSQLSPTSVIFGPGQQEKLGKLSHSLGLKSQRGFAVAGRSGRGSFTTCRECQDPERKHPRRNDFGRSRRGC